MTEQNAQPQGLGPAQEMPEGFAPLVQALDALQSSVHDLAIGSGKWEDEPNALELHAVMHVAIARATGATVSEQPLYNFKEQPPSGELVALADCVLLVMDYCESLGISLSQVLVRKHLADKQEFEHKRRSVLVKP